jgi:hypothetical protein
MLAGRIVAGGLLLVLGRKLFWLFVAVLGFVTGLTFAERLFSTQPEWVQLVIGIGFGIVGAILAYFFQEIAIAVGGFLAGAYIALSLVNALGGNPAPGGNGVNWVIFFVGGIVGAILAFMLFDWALIILSSLSGAMLIAGGLNLTGPISWLLIGGLFLVGIIVQANLERPPRQQTKSSSRTASAQ